MKNFLKNSYIQIAVGLLMFAYVYYFSNFGGSNVIERNEFKNSLPPVTISSFVAYLFLSSVLIALVRWFKLPEIYVYISHVLSLLVIYVLLYELFHSIAAGGIPMFL